MTFTIAQLQFKEPDANRAIVTAIYGRYDSKYAIYRTGERVSIQFGDDPELERQQRERLAKLAPLRSEINGLVDGWRGPEVFWFAWVRGGRPQEGAADRYDRRVAAALVVALEGDVEVALTILTQIREDVIAERKSRARALYLVWAAIVVILFAGSAGLAALIPGIDAFENPYGHSLWLGIAAGSLGAFFSIAAKIMDRSIRTDLQMQDNIIDALLRVTIGAISGLMLVAFLSTGVVRLTVGSTEFGAPNSDQPLSPWLITLIAGFAAGFLERLVPDLLATVHPTSSEPPQTPPRPMPERKEADRAASATPAVPPGTATADSEAVPAEVPEEERDADGCDVELDEAAGPATPDERLPQASGGVA